MDLLLPFLLLLKAFIYRVDCIPKISKIQSAFRKFTLWLIMLLRKPFRNRIHLTQLHLQVNSWLDDGLQPTRWIAVACDWSLFIKRNAGDTRHFTWLLNFVRNTPLFALPFSLRVQRWSFLIKSGRRTFVVGVQRVLKTKDRSGYGHSNMSPAFIVSSIFFCKRYSWKSGESLGVGFTRLLWGLTNIARERFDLIAVVEFLEMNFWSD